ncbi:MAG: DHH family phosphoesterase [Elusimicrobia bacterium]|nr:DHH family phosphoesterase [Elusimicrobiota bacterium]
MSEAFHARKLLRELTRLGPRLSPLLILTHDYPDPDSLASAWALAFLAHSLAKVRCRIAYGGIIGRRENRVMADRLGIPARPLRKGEIAEAENVALVDTQPPFRNNRFPPRRRPLLIIDHHPRHADTAAGLMLIDETAGATSSIMGEALLLSGLNIPRRLATAVVYGIGSETQNLGRESTARDLAVYQAFWPRANVKTLWSISYPRRPAGYFADLARGLRRAFACHGIVGTHLGPLAAPERVAQVADFLLTYERSHWALVTGRYQGRLHISLRTDDPTTHAGRLLKRILWGGKRGGGHAMIAGGTIEIGAEEPEVKWREAEDRLTAAFLESHDHKDSPLTYPFRDESL